MVFSNKLTVTFAGGEVTPDASAREDEQKFYAKSVARMLNFYADTIGPARFRSGSKYVHHTRNNNFAVFIEFQFNDQQSYLIEATEGYFRFYKDEGLILNSTPLTITGVSQASPGVVTYTGTDPANGQEVYIDGVVGMTQLNGRYFTVANVNTGANTFELTDVFGANVDTTGYTAYSSGGTASVVYEVKTPYLEADLRAIKFAQNADVMYLTHSNYEPRKLTRTAHDAWTLVRYTRTTDPFTTDNVTYGTITGITLANPGVISDAAHTFVADDHVYITGIVGTTELNDRHFKINTTGAGTYTLKDYNTGTPINTTAYTAWTSGGVVEKIGATKYPAAVTFTEGSRLLMAGTAANPEGFWHSKGPAASGAVRFDDFTTGTAATDALYFSLAPVRGKVDSIRWATSTDKYTAFGTFGSIRRVYGASEGQSVATDEITAKSANSDGVAVASPVSDGATIFYIGRSGLSVESLSYDYTVDGYVPDEKSLLIFHATTGGLVQLARQKGRPTLIWAVKATGELLALTYNAQEKVNGWHRHRLGGNGLVDALGVMPRENNQDQLWMIVKREINGHTVRYVEFFTDPPAFPVPEDFYTDEESKDEDLVKFYNYQSEVAKDAIHLDSVLTYDGSAYGTAAGATLTMGTGADTEDTEEVVVTASASVFTASMVGREIWGKYASDGTGGGRLEITEYTSGTSVKGTVLQAFETGAVFAAGDWFLTATTVSGLDHLEGEVVGLITDGAIPQDETVTNGAVTTAQPASKIHVGFKYTGMIKSLPLDQGGVSGPAMHKPKSIASVVVRFVNSAGVKFGPSPYQLQQIEFRRGNDVTGRPVPLFTGADTAVAEDGYDINKELFIVQDRALPCVVTAIDVFMDTSDE